MFTLTQQRVLSALFLYPERSYQLIELITFADSGSGTVQRLVARLVTSELVTIVPHGKRHLYRANRKSPIFEELRGMLVKTVGLVDPLRDALAPLAPKIRFAIVFGSIAKRSEHATSDVDVLIVGEVHLEDVFAAFEPVERTLSRKINPTIYSAAEYEDRRRDRNPFLTNVLSGDHIPLIGTPDEPPQAR